MIFLDLANLLDSNGNMQNEMMVMAFAATMFATIPGNTRLIPALGFVALDYRLIDKNVAKFLD